MKQIDLDMALALIALAVVVGMTVERLVLS